MFLEFLRDFEWLNEPQEFAFNERGLKITSDIRTDFWQDKAADYHKDNGHFFFCRRNGACTVTTHWRCGIPLNFAQCGLMGRIDEAHWFKISLFSKSGSSMNVGTVVTNDENSDMALVPVVGIGQEIWFKLKKNENGICELSYSPNGTVYTAIRKFRLNKETQELQIGAFICSPSETPYTAVLTSVDFI